MRVSSLTRLLALTALVALAAEAPASAAILISDFSGGVVAVNHPNPANGGTNASAPTYYDITSDAFATPSAGTLNGSAALKIVDGGFTNGVYALYSAVVPATGVYTVSADIDITEDAAQLNSIRAYQIGVIVNGVHRGVNPSDLAPASGPGSAVGSFAGLTNGNDNGLPTQNVVTSQFSANANDSLIIAFSTDVTSGNFDLNSASWGAGAFVLVDNIMLNAIPEPSTASLALAMVAGLASLRGVRRRG
jgi:hypothetical protein